MGSSSEGQWSQAHNPAGDVLPPLKPDSEAAVLSDQPHATPGCPAIHKGNAG